MKHSFETPISFMLKQKIKCSQSDIQDWAVCTFHCAIRAGSMKTLVLMSQQHIAERKCVRVHAQSVHMCVCVCVCVSDFTTNHNNTQVLFTIRHLTVWLHLSLIHI